MDKQVEKFILLKNATVYKKQMKCDEIRYYEDFKFTTNIITFIILFLVTTCAGNYIFTCILVALVTYLALMWNIEINVNNCRQDVNEAYNNYSQVTNKLDTLYKDDPSVTKWDHYRQLTLSTNDIYFISNMINELNTLNKV